MKSLVLKWARASLAPLSTVRAGAPWDDLKPLGQMLADATVVALSEGVHCATEPLEFRNRLLQYLVQEKEFTAIAIESGIVESRLLHDYVRGSAGDLDTVLARGTSWSNDQPPQNRALIRWLRQYNAASPDRRKVNFYGFDVPGCPATARPYFGYDTALHEVLQFLARVDPTASRVFRAR